MKPQESAPAPTPSCQTLLQLVSEDTMSNLLPVMALRPVRIMQVRNGDAARNPAMEAAAGQFKHALQVLSQDPAFKGYQPKITDLSLAHVAPEIGSTRDLVASTLATNQGVTVNFSGGTRLMSIGAYQAAAALGRPSLFCDTAAQRFSDGRTGGGQGRLPDLAAIASKLSARLLIAIGGRNPDDWRSDTATDALRAFGLKSFELRLPNWNVMEAFNKALRQTFYTNGDRLPTNAEELKELVLKPVPAQAITGEPVRQLLAAAVSAGLLRSDGHNYKLNAQPTRRLIERTLSLITHAWLELAVMDRVLQHPRYRDASWSVESSKNENADFSDTDIVCVDQETASLRLISCKTVLTRPPQEHLDALQERARRMGGPRAAATFVVLKPATGQENAIRSYARRLGVDVALEADEIVKMFSPQAVAR